MSTQLAAFTMSISFVLGLILLLVSGIYEKKEASIVAINKATAAKKSQVHRKMKITLLSGIILTSLSLTIFINCLTVVRNPETPIKDSSVETAVNEIIKIDSNNLYFKDGETFRYTDISRDIEIKENTSEYNFELVTESTRYLLDTFIESYRVSSKYIIYVDKETKEILEKIISSKNIIWLKY